MQISSSHSGFNFSSVYKSVVTRQVVPEAIPASTMRAFDEELDGGGKPAAEARREMLFLQSAHRSAERTANQLEATPDL